MKPAYLDAYFDALRTLGDHIEKTERAMIERAARMVADTLAQKGAWAIMDTGHMLAHEARLRAGGLLALTPFHGDLQLDEDILHRPSRLLEPAEEVAFQHKSFSLALDRSKLQAGDVLLINSNSGRTINVIEAARVAASRGIRTIGLASRAQLENCSAAHPEGLKLYDVVDLGLDNGAPFGDAAVMRQDGSTMCPLSGIASASILWAIQAEAVALLEATGRTPSVYQSVHTVGQDAVDALRSAFSEQGI